MAGKKTAVPIIVALAALTAVAALYRSPDRLDLGGCMVDRIEQRINTYTRSDQSHLALDMDARGNVVAAWDSRRQDLGTYGVFARWIDASGSFRGPEEQVNVERRSAQMKPSVAVHEGGDVWFAWQSWGQDGELGSIVARTAGDERVVNAAAAGDQEAVVVDRLDGGRRVAVWTTFATDPQASRIALRVFEPDGEPLAGERTIDAPAAHRDRLPTVAATPGGGFVVAWARTRASGDSDGIHACRFDDSGAAVGEPFRVSEPGAAAIEPSISADAAGRFVVAWLELDETTDYDVVFRRYGADGTPLDSPRYAAADRSGWESGAAVAAAPGGKFLVAWNTHADGGLDADVYARLFDGAGRPLTPEFRVNRHTAGVQRLAAATGARRIAMTDDGRIAVAWEGDSGQGDPTAANVTLLLPARGGLAGDLAAAVRGGGRLLASLFPQRDVHLASTAAPHVPPTYDESMRSPLIDPNSQFASGRSIGFTAFTSTGWVPPDPHMAAGPSHLMAIVNGGIAAYSKDGTRLWFDDISGAGGFWGEVGANFFVFDPEVIYDPYENRFMAMANERSDNNHSYFLLGISASSDPTGPFHKYRFDVTALAGNDIDSPNIAVDDEAIYLTADFFTPNEKYLIYIIDKASVIDGGAAITRSRLHTGSQSFGIPVMYSTDAPTMYMIEHFETDPSSQVRLWAIQDPLGVPTLVSYNLAVPAYYRPSELRSGGTSVTVFTFDARFWSCMYRNGSLWAAQHMSLSNSPRITVSRWYEIEMNGWPTSGENPTLRQSGTVAPAGNVYCSFNSIFADEGGNAMMVFARSSTTEFFSISRVCRHATDLLGSMSPPSVVKESATQYTSNRWGDYSAIVTDPSDPDLFWMHHEYAAAPSIWHTWIAGFALDEPIAVEPGIDVAQGRLRVSPSPTSGATAVTFDLPEAADVRIEVYDAGGRLVRRIADGHRAAGVVHTQWDGEDALGRPVASGTYLVRVVAGERAEVQRVSVIR
jgi:hypothetical protein